MSTAGSSGGALYRRAAPAGRRTSLRAAAAADTIRAHERHAADLSGCLPLRSSRVRAAHDAGVDLSSLAVRRFDGENWEAAAKAFYASLK